MIYKFNRNILDTTQYQLRQGNQNTPIDPIVFDLLLYLIEHRKRLVTRDELLDNIWKGKVVTDSALGARIRDVRRAVCDSGANQSVVKTIHGRGYQFMAAVEILPETGRPNRDVSTSGSKLGLANQSPIQYCVSTDGVKIAHAQVGEGPPLVIAGSWMTHLEEDWNNTSWSPYLSHLANNFRLIRYDQRGNGMSDWKNVDISFDKMVDDLKAVINSYELGVVAIFGPSQAASVSATYALRYPKSVSKLVLHGGYARGRQHRGYPGCKAESEALVTLIRQSWASQNPAIRQAYTSLMMPDASQEEVNWFNNFQKNCGPAENIARFREMFDDIDIVDSLKKVQAPTLIAHNIEDSVAPISEGNLLAENIPNSTLVTFNSKNHMMFENEPEFGKFIDTVCKFLKD